MPKITILLVATPCARAMRAFAPVARIAKPVWVEKNQSIKNFAAITKPKITKGCIQYWLSNLSPIKPLYTLGSPIKGTLGEPMMRKFTEYKATITKIPASNCRIFSDTCIQAVSIPAKPPATMAKPHANQGFTPFTMHTAHTAPPKGKEPSAVKSGKSRMRKEMYTPNATKA